MREITIQNIPAKVNERILRLALEALDIKLRYSPAGTITLPDNITTEAVPASMVLIVPDNVNDGQARAIVASHNPQKTDHEERRDNALQAFRNNAVIADILQRLEALESK
jgi:hypothetical protein